MTGEYILTYEALSNEDCTLYFIAVSTLGSVFLNFNIKVVRLAGQGMGMVATKILEI